MTLFASLALICCYNNYSFNDFFLLFLVNTFGCFCPIILPKNDHLKSSK